MLNISVDAKQFTAAKKLLDKFPEEVNRAAAVAINRTLTTVRKETSVTIRKNYVVKAGDIKKSMTLKRADRNRLKGLVETVGGTLPLEKFKLSSQGNVKREFQNFSRGRTTSKKKQNPIKVQVLKSGGLKPVRRLFRLPLASRFGGRYGGFLFRKTRRRYPLKIPAGPSVPQMFGAERTLDELAPIAQKELDERFQHEIEYRMRRKGL